MSRTFTLPGSVLLVLVVCTHVGWSQTISVPEHAPLESIVISAEKRGSAEDAQTVPISLTAINSDEIAQRHALNMHDLTTAAPNTVLTEGLPGLAMFAIRGLGVNTSIPSIEPAVGLFVDGIYIGMPTGAVIDLVDIQDVEILRGPQGSLFGHNTTGGAILVNTSRPGDAFAAHGSIGYETGPQEIISASIEGPLGTQFRAKLSGRYRNDDGWFTNQFDGSSFGAWRSYTVRPTVTWAPTAALESTLIYEHGSTRGDGTVGQNSTSFQGFNIGLNDPEYSHLDWDSVTSETNWRLADGVITNLAGFRTFDQEGSIDNDGLPVSLFRLAARTDQHQFSEELRYSGSLFDAVDLTAGLYYFTQSYTYLERRVLPGSGIDSTLGASVDASNYAAFAEIGYHLDPGLTLIAAGRFTRDEKDAKIATFAASTALSRCNFAARSCIYNFPGPAFPGSPGQKAWDYFMPKLGFKWQRDDDVFVYGQWARGVRGGGYNVRNTSTSVPPGPYDNELQDSFELGMKSSWLETRLRANAALFYNKIDAMQRDVSVPDPVVGVVQVTRNTADATIKGFELELAYAITDELELSANTGYTDGKYDKIFYDLDGGGIGPSDYHLAIPRLVRWSYALGGTYAHHFSPDFLFRLRADYGYRSRAASTDDNSAFLPQIEELSAAASLTLPGHRWSLSLYGRNLLDKVSYGVNTSLPASLGGGMIRTLNKGRVIGIEAGFSY